MNYISVSEAAKKWNISLRQVQRLVSNNRISGTRKLGKSWMIPAEAEKPSRRKKKLPNKPLSAEFSYVIESTTMPMPADNPDAILKTIEEERLRIEYECELSYLRGDFEQVMHCFRKTEGDDAVKLRACPVAIAAAISMGDYRTYTEIDAYLKRCIDTNTGSEISAFADLALATASTGAIAPNMLPKWLKEGDFSALPAQAKVDAIYKRTKYFLSIGRYKSAIATAQTALALCTTEQGITFHDIYFRLICAVAYNAIESQDEAKRWLLDAMNISLPHGFVSPFAELVPAFGSLMELCLKESFPDYYDTIMGQCERTFKNWITFHNLFTKDNITLILSLREYHIAQLAARRVPYAEIAKQYNISVGRLKNIMLEIYEKLYISGRNELAKYVF